MKNFLYGLSYILAGIAALVLIPFALAFRFLDIKQRKSRPVSISPTPEMTQDWVILRDVRKPENVYKPTELYMYRGGSRYEGTDRAVRSYEVSKN